MKILVIDDVIGWCRYHSDILKTLYPDAEIHVANSAREGYDKLLENNDNPFNLVLTDMQMENDFEPKYAGEWLIEQSKTLKNYSETIFVIISAAYNISNIAEYYKVKYIRKSTARSFPDVYKSILN